MSSTGTVRRANINHEHGQSLVMFAVLLPIILFIAVLSVDVGNWWVHQKRLQTQVDAGALAAGPIFRECFRDDQSLANTRIAAEAAKYAGDFRRDTASLNRQVQEPGDVYVALNASRYWKQSDGDSTPSTGYGLDYSMDSDPSTPGIQLPSDPCSARFLDVKATDDEVIPLWGRIQNWRDFSLSVSPRTHAKVEARKLQGLSGFLPWAVPEVNPRTVAALFVDQTETDTVDSWAFLGGPADPNDTETLNGETAARWNGLASVNVVSQTGMIVFTSRQLLANADFAGKSLSQICALPTGACYGGTTNTSGIEFVRGTPVTQAVSPGGPVVLETVELTTLPPPAGIPNPPSTVSCATTDPDSAPYFLYNADCQVRIRAQIEFGSLPSPRVVRVNGNASCNSGVALSLRDGWWESTWLPTIDNGSRQNGYTLCWRAGTGGGAPRGNWGGQLMQMAYAAFPRTGGPGSGPIVYSAVRSPSSGCTAYANALDTGAQTLCIDVGLEPPLREVGADDPPLFLRIHGGSLNQMLDCDASPRGPDEEIRDGCQTPYQVNTRDLVCEPNPTYRPSNMPPPLPPPDPDPWPDCIEANPGNVESMSKGIAARFEDGPPEGASCPPNLWDTYRLNDELPPSDDPRVVTLIIAEYGTFDSEGIKVLPITKFAGFYVTGWFTKSAPPMANGCPDNDPPPTPPFCGGGPCDSDDNKVQGAVWGYFIRQVDPFPGGRPAPDLCDFDAQLATCIPALVE